ncbi:MAG: inositol phosphorylceramide synthase [Opitutaceae bacterium]|nr:inositol phosphorylceramide synthase [Opitutaceae bacterium]
MLTGSAIRREWTDWWQGMGALARWLPVVGALAFLGLHLSQGGLRLDHGWLVGSVLTGYYAGPRARPWFLFLLPLIIVGAVYDAQRYWAEAVRASVRVAEPHAWELRWFGLNDGGSLVTPAAWWQTRTNAGLDLVCGAAYLLFIPVFLFGAGWWRFKLKAPGSERVMWALLGLNLAGYAVYLIYPAAPPWYVDRYGLGPAVLTALPEAAGAARFDALLGVHWFADYYGRNANVFGAIPSLHVGQTFLLAVYAWQFRSNRVFTTTFWLLVFFASVYLNHHYVIDGLAGMILALGVWGGLEGWARRGAGAFNRG